MSTRKKKGKGIDLFGFLERRGLEQSIVDYFSLTLRMSRECLKAGQASIEQWEDLAGMINVGGFRASELDMHAEVAVLNMGSVAMKEIIDQHEDGPLVASDEQIAWITDALNCLEYQVWDRLTLQDFLRIAEGIERKKEQERERASI